MLIAIGAILRWAVTTTTSGFSIATIGLILLIVGIVGLVLSLLWLYVYAPRHREAPPYETGQPPYRPPY